MVDTTSAREMFMVDTTSAREMFMVDTTSAREMFMVDTTSAREMFMVDTTSAREMLIINTAISTVPVEWLKSILQMPRGSKLSSCHDRGMCAIVSLKFA